MTLDLKTARVGDVVITRNSECGVIVATDCPHHNYPIVAYFGGLVRSYSQRGVYRTPTTTSKLDLVQHIPQNEWPTPQTTVPQPTDYDVNGNIQILRPDGWSYCSEANYHCFDKSGWAHTPLWYEPTPKEKLIAELKVAKDKLFGTSTAELRILLGNTLKYLENDEPPTSKTN